jgi:surfactin synthase thioesterase subunit
VAFHTVVPCDTDPLLYRSCVVVSGRPAPSAGLGLPVPRGDDDILAELERTGTVAPHLLARPSIRRSLVSVLRPDGACAWSGHTTGGFRIAQLPGGHAFLDDHAEAAAAEVAREL